MSTTALAVRTVGLAAGAAKEPTVSSSHCTAALVRNVDTLGSQGAFSKHADSILCAKSIATGALALDAGGATSKTTKAVALPGHPDARWIQGCRGIGRCNIVWIGLTVIPLSTVAHVANASAIVAAGSPPSRAERKAPGRNLHRTSRSGHCRRCACWG